MVKERNRNLMLHEFKCGHLAAAATRNIQGVPKMAY
jgi:hypothetical protein